jgi:RNA polymerase sigma-70 factor (ECF subfamily)
MIGEMPLRLGDREAVRPDIHAIHEEHADFVWRTLQRMGVRDADVEDQLQEVFVVVHRRLGTFDGSSRMTTWLFGICMRVASAYRRRAHRRHEEVVADVPERSASSDAGPEGEAMAREARERLVQVLDMMDLDKRVVFVMFELEEIPCEKIAEILGVPVGTVHSRLHAARQSFQVALKRFTARDASLAARGKGGQP